MMVIPSPVDTGNVYALLSAISDPAKAKQNLDNITQAIADLATKQKDYQDLVARENALVSKQADLEASMSQNADDRLIIQNLQDAIKTQQAVIDADKSALVFSQKEFNTEVSRQTAALDARQADLSKREAVVEDNISKTADELLQTQALKQSYQDKLNQLKSLVD